MKYNLLYIAFLCFAASLSAQRTVNVCAEYDYAVPESESMAEAKRSAIDKARNQAIADEFGTVVSQTTTAAMSNTDGKTQSSFSSFGSSEVRGLWISDTKEPEFKIYYEREQMIIRVSVCGKVREIQNAQVETQTKVFNRDIENTVFNNNDRLSVSFKSASKGYVALFIRDDINEVVNVMMPYDEGNGHAREVKSNKEYIFLSTRDPEYPYAEETILTTEKTIEYNTLIVVFSQKEFHVALANQGEFVPEVATDKFQKWLHSLRIYDTTVQVEEIVLTIKK